MKRIGYHYTSKKNWERIKTEGLIPYLIERDDINKYFPGRKVFAVWVWRDRLKGRSHLGSLLFQLCDKDEMDVVLLKVKYNDDDRLSAAGGKIIIYHQGDMRNFTYHEDVVGHLVDKIIPVEDITFVKEYNFIELTK